MAYTIEDIIRFLSDIMDDTEQKTEHRLKASDALAKLVAADAELEPDRALHITVDYGP